MRACHSNAAPLMQSSRLLHHGSCACLRYVRAAGSDRSAWLRMIVSGASETSRVLQQSPRGQTHRCLSTSEGTPAAQHTPTGNPVVADTAAAGTTRGQTSPSSGLLGHPGSDATTGAAAIASTSSSSSSSSRYGETLSSPAAWAAQRSVFSPPAQQPLLLPEVLDAAHAQWLYQQLGLAADFLDKCRIGSTTVYCPGTGAQEHVIMLPYIVQGVLEDATYLQPPTHPGGCPLRWMARGGKHLYVSDEERQQLAAGVQDVVVFVSDELEKLAVLQAAPSPTHDSSDPGWPILVALPDPIPSWQHQQQQVPPDPEKRLVGLQEQLILAQHRHQSSTPGFRDRVLSGLQATSGRVGEADQKAPLELLLPGAVAAIIAFGTPGSTAPAYQRELAHKLAEVLGAYTCVYLRWQRAHEAHVPQPHNWEAAAADWEGEADSEDGELLQQQQQQQLAQVKQSLVEVLHTCGPQLVGRLLLEPDPFWGPWPVSGLERFKDYQQQILARYHMAGDVPVAVSTGWQSLDTFYKVAPGEVTLVTGVPNSGKSEWLDALIVNLAEAHGWRFALASMEKAPVHHVRQLVEKRLRKPFFSAGYAQGVERMSQEELQQGFHWAAQHFFPILSTEQQQVALSFILQCARVAKIRHGIKGLIIDPYNELASSTDSGRDGLGDHERVNLLMAELRSFAKQQQVHVWLVAHPRQRPNWRGEAPSLSDIAGGANFWNKADNGIVVHRLWNRLSEMQDRGGQPGRVQPRSRSSTPTPSHPSSGGAAMEDVEVQIRVEKVRNKTTGCQGECALEYDRVTGRYQEPEPDQALLAQLPWHDHSTGTYA